MHFTFRVLETCLQVDDLSDEKQGKQDINRIDIFDIR